MPERPRIVVEGPEAIAEARRVARAVRRRRVDSILENLHRISLSEHTWMNELVRQRRRVVTKLRAVPTEPDGPDRDRLHANAIVLLWHLGAAGGRDLLRERLRTGRSSVKIAILRALVSIAILSAHHVDGERYDVRERCRSRRFRIGDIGDLLVDLCDSDSGDPAVVDTVHFLARFVSIPGVAPKDRSARGRGRRDPPPPRPVADRPQLEALVGIPQSRARKPSGRSRGGRFPTCSSAAAAPV